jgi:hypothetical protein
MCDYSLWKQGRDASGQIVSMERHTCPGSATPIGVLDLPFRALEAIAELGKWYEKHQMRKLQEAQFAERRHQWMRDILNQWAEEHRDRHSIRIDVTQAVADESRKLFNALVENPRADVPQTLLVYSDRMADLFDEATAFFGKTLDIVQTSSNQGSKGYDLPKPSETRAKQFKDRLFARSRGLRITGSSKKQRRVAWKSKNYKQLVRLRFAAYNLVNVTKDFRKTMEKRDEMEHVFARNHNDRIQIASVDESQTVSPPTGGVRTIDLTTS